MVFCAKAITGREANQQKKKSFHTKASSVEMDSFLAKGSTSKNCFAGMKSNEIIIAILGLNALRHFE
jgi:hypothetical protein